VHVIDIRGPGGGVEVGRGGLHVSRRRRRQHPAGEDSPVPGEIRPAGEIGPETRN